MESSDRLSRVDACIEWLRARLDARVFRPGTRVPSVRALARLLEVSPFTAAEAYARLAAAGVIEARRGSGYYVGAIAPHAPRAVAAASAVDLKWLMQQMLDSGRAARGPGLGVLPPAWLDGESLGASLRAVGREGSGGGVCSKAARRWATRRYVRCWRDAWGRSALPRAPSRSC